MTAYYNEIDPYAVQWLRNLIDAGHIAFGIVDDRSIEDVRPRDLDGFTQCHFFAGIGGWSLALRLAGWPDDRFVWSGSCPCQPFSAAGKGAGFADERHLWPAFHHLIGEHRPERIFGEQVASRDAEPWLDLVQDDLEALGYAVGAVPFPAASLGAPHIRDRLYWVADSHNARLERRARTGRADQCTVGARGVADQLADTERERVRTRGQRCTDGAAETMQGIDGERQRFRPDAGSGDNDASSLMADTNGRHASAERQQRGGQHRQQPQDGSTSDMADADGGGRVGQPVCLRERGQDQTVPETAGRGPLGGFWSDAEWIFCRDEKWRPVEPGTFPLAHGIPNRVGRLRAYGNAIVAQQAAEFIRASQ